MNNYKCIIVCIFFATLLSYYPCSFVNTSYSFLILTSALYGLYKVKIIFITKFISLLKTELKEY